MSSQAELRAAAWAAISGLARPITHEQALDAARAVLPRKEIGDFEKWLAVNGASMLEKLNG